MAHWLPIWATKAGQDPAAASGRSGYGEGHMKALITDAVSALSLNRFDSLLDVGCAAGFMGEELLTWVQHYIAIDPIPEMVAAFRARCPRATAMVGTATDLSLWKDGAFTKTLMSSVLLVLSRDEGLQAIRELRRVTAPGGRGFISGNVFRTSDKSPQGTDCDADCRCYAHVTAWPPHLLIPAVLDAGWKNPQHRPLNPVLPQSTYQWDLLVHA